MSSFGYAIEEDFKRFLQNYPEFWKRISYGNKYTQNREISLSRFNERCDTLGIKKAYDVEKDDFDLEDIHKLMLKIMSQPALFEICLI